MQSAAESTTAAAVVSPVTKADVQPQAQPVVHQQTTPPSTVSATSQQAQTPSSPAPPQRPARRKQAGQAPQPAAQPSPSRPASGQPPGSQQQQITQPSAAQAQPAFNEISQKAAETVRGLLLTIQLQTVSAHLHHHHCQNELCILPFYFSIRLVWRGLVFSCSIMCLHI